MGHPGLFLVLFSVFFKQTETFKNGPTPQRALFRLFSVFFKQTIQYLQQINVKKYPSSIQRRDSNPRPLEHGSSPITTHKAFISLATNHLISESLTRWIPCSQKVGIICERERAFNLPTFKFPTTFINDPFDDVTLIATNEVDVDSAGASFPNTTLIQVGPSVVGMFFSKFCLLRTRTYLL